MPYAESVESGVIEARSLTHHTGEKTGREELTLTSVLQGKVVVQPNKRDLITLSLWTRTLLWGRRDGSGNEAFAVLGG